MFDCFGLGYAFDRYDIKDKERSSRDYIKYMLCRTQSRFEYKGLPDTMPQRTLELYLQVNGHVAIIRHEGDLYSFFGNWGGVPDEYYIPTKYIIANPYLNLFDEYTVNEDCIVMGNDSLYVGLMPLMSKYANMLSENDVSLYVADINSRVLSIVSATDDRTRASAEEFFRLVMNGDVSAIVSSNEFLDGLKSQPYMVHGGTGLLTSLIEYHQYLRAGWFNELGLNANYNMKRESIMSSEAALNDDMLYPLIDDMLRMRKNACDDINSMFGTDISVELSSSWAINQEELDMAMNGGDSDDETFTNDNDNENVVSDP